MMKKTMAMGLLLLAMGVHAEPSAAKKALITKLLKLQQPAIEQMAVALVEQPAAQMMQQAVVALQTLPPEKRQAVGKEMQADIKVYLDGAAPMVRERAVKLAPTTIGAVLDEKFSEAELKKIIEIIESPVNKKFLQAGADMQKALVQQLVGEVKDSVEPKVKALNQSLSKRITAATATGTSSAPAKPASN